MNNILDLIQNNQLIAGGIAVTALGYFSNKLQQIPTNIKAYILRKITFSVRFTEEDVAHEKVLEWVDTKLKPTHFTGKWVNKNFKLLPGYGNHFMWYKKTPIWISRTTAANNKNSGNFMEDLAKMKQGDTCTLTLLGRNTKVLLELLEEIKQFHYKPDDPTIDVYNCRYGTLFWHSSLSRNPVSVYGKYFKQICKDVEIFISKEELYKKRNVSHKRGYLLYGPPGSGKSTIALALATRFKKNLAAIPLSSVTSVSDLQNCMYSAYARSGIILIEDIDTYFNGREVISKDMKLNFSDFINTLDGINLPSGPIIIITTNKRETLDAALTRPGRIDKEFFVDYLDKAELVEILTDFYPNIEETKIQTAASYIKSNNISTAKLQIETLSAESFDDFLNRIAAACIK